MFRLAIVALLAVGIAGAAPSEQDLLRAIAAHPGDPGPHTEYAIHLQSRGRAVEAVAHFRTAYDLAPGAPAAVYNLALGLLAAERPVDALALLDKHPASRPDEHALRGSVLNALGRPRDAAQSLRRAVALDPNDADTVYDLALTLLRIDSGTEALALLDKARARFPGAAKIHAASGAAAYAAGKNDAAVRAYETAVKLEPGAADFHLSLGDVYVATGDFARAESAYARSLRLEPEAAPAWVKRGKNLLKLQRPQEARQAFERALRIEPANAEALFETGKLEAAGGDHAAAIAHWERAVRAAPGMKEAWYQLSIAYRRSGDDEKSKAAAERYRTAK